MDRDKGDDMSKYQVGDEVLVRVQFDAVDAGFHINSKCGLHGWVDPTEIYSKAPPFEIGEEIEVRDLDSSSWSKGRFVGMNEDIYLIDGGAVSSRTSGWRQARKITPVEHMAKYRTKPVVKEAVQWRGDNLSEIQNFYRPNQILSGNQILIDTLEGTMVADLGDWIIKGLMGEFYPCKPDIFEQTYELVE